MQKITMCIRISIPSGAIKSFNQIISIFNIVISIPSGAIKSVFENFSTFNFITFQFLLVRLRGYFLRGVNSCL